MNKTFETKSITTKKVQIDKYLTLKHTYIDGAYNKTELIRDYSHRIDNIYPKEVTILVASNTIELQAFIELMQGGIEV